MQQANLRLGRTIPKLPRQSTKRQYSLKSILVVVLLAGPVVALLANPEPVLVFFYRFALLLFAVSPRTDLGIILKFVIVGVIAFGIVPLCVAKLHPMFALIGCFVWAGATIVLWNYATNSVAWHHPFEETARSLSFYDPRRVLENRNTRLMLDFELAFAATFVWLGIILGGVVSISSRKGES